MYKKSFSFYEKKYLPKYRDMVNKSRNIVELSNAFAHTVHNFLVDATDIEINTESITFNSEYEPYYSIKSILLKNDKFNKLIDNSDLLNIINRFAKTAHDRYMKVQKHNDKTNKKIRKVT